METQQSYQTVLIGCGARQREHVPGLLSDGRCQITAVCDVNRQAAEKLLADFKLDAVIYTDHLTMLREQKPRMAVVCLWTGLHAPVFGDCVAAGVKIVHSEKPMAPTLGECRAMSQLARQSGTQLTFSHQRRFAKGNQLVHQLLQEGTIGKVERMELYAPPNLLDCGTHTFDQAFSFLDQTPVKWVLGAWDASAALNWFNVPSENQFIGMMAYENGVTATIQFGGPDLSIWGGIRIHGEQGFIEVMWDGDFKRAVRYADPAWQAPPSQDDTKQFAGRMIKHILDCAENGTEPVVSHEKALQAAEVIFAFYESVRRRARIDPPLKDVEDNPYIALCPPNKPA